ncbi:serine protease [Hyphomicrobium sp.]|uniref:S1C family serine protease n=1 Tax=Hyphomicrobium sp. TaxID=82 RepID=UPI0025B9A36E|nr:serine protease [Hyphomicrobium sp.]
MRRGRILPFIVAAIVIFLDTAYAQEPPLPFQSVASATSESAREILGRVRPSVIMISGFYGTNSAPAFHGTGFSVTADGAFLTNYHVVAELVTLPGKYRLEYRTNEGKTGKLQVVVVDVRHDLAVVRADDYAAPPLKIASSNPEKGERAFSVGFPLDVGLTITEGISNGLVQDSFEARLHYSGAINAGMSGGPAFDASGNVIGINVSGYFLQQLVSFLVPVDRAKSLIARASGPLPDAEMLKADVLAQVRAHSNDLLGALDGPIKTQVVGGFILPAQLAPFVDCSASGDTSSNRPVDRVRIECNGKAGIQLRPGFVVGDIHYIHTILTDSKLGSWRFANRLSAFSAASGRFGLRQHLGPFACETRAIKLKGFDANAIVCARGYRKLTGIYDFTVRVVSLSYPDRGFVSHLDLSGLEFDSGLAFVQRFLESMESQP